MISLDLWRLSMRLLVLAQCCMWSSSEHRERSLAAWRCWKGTDGRTDVRSMLCLLLYTRHAGNVARFLSATTEPIVLTLSSANVQTGARFIHSTHSRRLTELASEVARNGHALTYRHSFSLEHRQLVERRLWNARIQTEQSLTSDFSTGHVLLTVQSLSIRLFRKAYPCHRVQT